MILPIIHSVYLSVSTICSLKSVSVMLSTCHHVIWQIDNCLSSWQIAEKYVCIIIRQVNSLEITMTICLKVTLICQMLENYINLWKNILSTGWYSSHTTCRHACRLVKTTKRSIWLFINYATILTYMIWS